MGCNAFWKMLHRRRGFGEKNKGIWDILRRKADLPDPSKLAAQHQALCEKSGRKCGFWTRRPAVVRPLFADLPKFPEIEVALVSIVVLALMGLP